MKARMIPLVTLFVLVILIGNACAISVSVSQSGADDYEVMKDSTFTVEASGWTGDCSQATMSFSGCSSCSLSGENSQKSIGGGATSIAWTTISASQLAAAQSITVSVSGGCTLQQETSDSFDIVLPPSLSVDASTDVSEVDDEETFEVNLDMVNNGETTAKDVSTSVSGSGMSISSGCSSISEIEEGQSAAQSCTIKASSPGTPTVTFTISSTNADSASDSFSMTVNSVGGDSPPSGSGDTSPSGGPVVGPSDEEEQERERVRERKNISLVPGVGIRNNMRLQNAIQKVLGMANMSEQARENMLRLSESISSEMGLSKNFSSGSGKTTLSLKFTHGGAKKIRNFMVYDTVPKTFANSSENVTVIAEGASIEVVESDPEYLFVYPEVLPDQELSVTYSVEKELAQSVIDDTSTEVYAESLEEIIEPECTVPGERRCSGDEVQECQNNEWVTTETCQHGCVSGVCKAAPPVQIDWMLVGGIAVIVVVVIAVVAVVMGFKTKKGSDKHKWRSLPKPPSVKPKI